MCNGDEDTSTWPAEAAPLAAMGGCGMVTTALGAGLTCSDDLAESATIQGMAPGISGSLCDYCCSTCDGAGSPCGGPRRGSGGVCHGFPARAFRQMRHKAACSLARACGECVWIGLKGSA